MNIIKSYKEPDKHTIWFNTNDNNFYYFNNGKWRLLNNLESVLEITYFLLKELRDTSKLIPGATYRITDYTCTTVQEGTRSAGHDFDILVTADDVNVLNENAHAIQHSGDTYFENSDLSAWELKYCLDNDTTRFVWADDSSAGRGVVYYMKDELNNECPYDFKNIQFKLVKLSSITWNDNVSEDLKNSYEEQFVGNYVGDWFTVNEAGTANLNTGDTTYTYTFSGALNVDGTVEGTIGRFGNNTIEPYYNDSEETYAMLLNHIVIIDDDGNDSDNMTSNKFGGNCHHIYVYGYSFNNNTFGNDCNNNTFGNDFKYNTFGNECYNNILVNRCYSNILGNDCYNNTFGNNFQYNTFGNSCSSNTFENSCISNTLGNNFNYNTLGNDCRYNIFGNDCYSNILGNNCRYNSFGNCFKNNTLGIECNTNIFGNNYNENTFGDSCVNNRIGNNCWNNTVGNKFSNNTLGNRFVYNTIGNECWYNTFGNTFRYNTFSNDYIYNCTFFDGVEYLNVSITTTNTNKLLNMQVLNGTQGTSGSKLLITGSTYVTAGCAYTTTIGKNSSGTLTSKVLMD